MTKMEQIVNEALKAEGIAEENWKKEIKITYTGYQFISLEITVYEPRHRKPSTVWEAPYDSFRNILHWEDAQLIYNKHC